MPILSLNEARFGQEIFVSEAVPGTHSGRCPSLALRSDSGSMLGLSEGAMGRSHPMDDRPTQYDADVLLAIRDALRSAYDDVLKQPMPHDMRALLARLEHETDSGDAGPDADPICRVPAQRLFRHRAGRG